MNVSGSINVEYSWNKSEVFLQQFKQVALHKFTELNVNKLVQDNISNTFAGFDVAPTSQQAAQETTDVMSAILEEIKGIYPYIQLSEQGNRIKNRLTRIP